MTDQNHSPVQQMATAPTRAKDKFVAILVDQYSYTKQQANIIFVAYHKAKVLKFDCYHATYTVKHGVFWEKSCLENALTL